MEIRDYLKTGKVLMFDGAMGTMLQRNGLKMGENPEIFAYKNPDILRDIHRQYLDAGTNTVLTCTFGCNELKLPEGYTVEMIIDNAVKTAREAIGESSSDKEKFVALDIGPIGEMLEPMGTLSFDRAYEIFKREVVRGVKAGVDVIVIETMMDLLEIKAAVLAAKENSDLPVFATMTFDEDGRSFTGCLPESMVYTIGGLGVDAIGVNCSLGPVQLLPIVEKICAVSQIPVMVQANAGLPSMHDGQATYDIGPDEYWEGVKKFIEAGASIIGGCCGTDPSYIKKISDNLSNVEIGDKNNEYVSAVCSPSKVVRIDEPRVVGERINPTGRKAFKEALKSGNTDYAVRLAIEQVNGGADILEINTGLPGIDERKAMVDILKEVQSVTDTPVQIDSSVVESLEAGLRYCNGRTIVNSVNGKDESLETILPLVKKYGACVVGLTLDERGISEKAEERVEIAKKIIKRAEEFGIRREDIYIDCLSLTVSAQQEAAYETLKAMKEVKKLGVHTTLGVSNISFGLPNRQAVNSAFLTLALDAGLDLAIINPNNERMMEAITSYKVIRNIDKGCTKFVERYSDVDNKKDVKSASSSSEMSLFNLVEKGIKDEAKSKTIEMLKDTDENYILDEILIPALDVVGKKFEKGEIFLPQMIQSAEAVKASLTVIKENLINKNGDKKEDVSKGKIILATVEGDIHDIGKNIVKIMLENYGYEIIDLGRDVPVDKVVEKAIEENIKLVGLSALMTTTVKSMEETIKALKEKMPEVKIFVGGAVLTEDYASEIGADFYAKDAKSAVEIAKIIL